MPNTYATVITGNLNQQSGDLNLTSLYKNDRSQLNITMSPKSHQANLKTNLLRKQGMMNAMQNTGNDYSNKDLTVASGVGITQSDATFLLNGSSSASHVSRRFFKRRPQTTKRIVSRPKNSHFNLPKDSSMLSSVQQHDPTKLTVNEAAFVQTAQKQYQYQMFGGEQQDGDELAANIKQIIPANSS